MLCANHLLLKLKDFLDKGYRFKELVAYIDISDIQDEANYAIVDGKVVEKIEDTRKHKMFPVAHFGIERLRDGLSVLHRSTPLSHQIY